MTRIATFLVAAAFTASLIGCAMSETSGVQGDTMDRKDLHLVITKPATWRFLSPKEKFAARYAVTYKNTRWDMYIKQARFPARIVIAKFPEPRNALNPSVSIDLYPLGPLYQNSPLRAAALVLNGYESNIFTPVIMVEPLRITKFAGKEAGYFHLRFVLETKNGPTHEIDERVWTIMRGTSAYIIFAHDAQSGPDVSRAQLDDILQSLNFLE